MSQGNSVYSCSKWPHSKAGQKACHHRDERDAIMKWNGDNRAHFQTVSRCCTRHSTEVVVMNEVGEVEFKPCVLSHWIGGHRGAGGRFISVDSTLKCECFSKFWRKTDRCWIQTEHSCCSCWRTNHRKYLSCLKDRKSISIKVRSVSGRVIQIRRNAC